MKELSPFHPGSRPGVAERLRGRARAPAVVAAAGCLLVARRIGLFDLRAQRRALRARHPPFPVPRPKSSSPGPAVRRRHYMPTPEEIPVAGRGYSTISSSGSPGSRRRPKLLPARSAVTRVPAGVQPSNTPQRRTTRANATTWTSLAPARRSAVAAASDGRAGRVDVVDERDARRGRRSRSESASHVGPALGPREPALALDPACALEQALDGKLPPAPEGAASCSRGVHAAPPDAVGLAGDVGECDRPRAAGRRRRRDPRRAPPRRRTPRSFQAATSARAGPS